MGRVQAPQQAHFMRQEMIDKVCKFPNDIAVNEPVPGKRGFKKRVFFEQANANEMSRPTKAFKTYVKKDIL